ncbi:hypothetical protein C8R47DRAFT_546123 [Mycena vitilis]|nr:hypothetical protein C8R47DRAFT_546123 [Mycena vitilis]
MSHLTASPFHKPSPFEFPRRSAPAETPQASQLPTPSTTSIIGGQDPHAAEYFETPTASVTDPASRFRRVASSIVYHNSGLRESRERTVQRSSRSFVVVLPPPSLPQDHGHLGHTLSSGPRHRLSHGLLMPLFPTMYGQLTAIAREYNFPSTAGLCLYLHYTDNGITVTPRIADDSWQMIWSHALEPAPNAPHSALPISGKIEFDIDMRLARWYGAWMASSHREHVDVPMSVTPSAAPSVIHYREDSRTTFADAEEQDSHSVARPPVRHIPRKLSLIDRFDAMSARSVPRSVVARPSPPAPLPAIFQEDEPKTAKYDLEHRVNTWRASASVLPGAIAEAGHILLAGDNLPDTPLEDSPMRTSNDEEQNEDEYRIEDYSFSISSAGPGDYDPYSPLTWYYDPSVHLAHRAQGSVCMTASDCTSVGPSDYTLPSYMAGLESDGIRTPDIAHRMFEEVPPSPSVATSWGAPLSYPPSPRSEYRAASVHLGDRHGLSRPATPMTATSWGAPESYPPSPTTPFYVHTPDAGQRTFDLSALSEHDTPWSLVWPYHDASRRPEEVIAQAAGPGRSLASPWNMIWPYLGAGSETSTFSISTVSVTLAAAYPCLNIYPPVYPYFDIYPGASGTAVASPDERGPVTIIATGYPVFNLYPVYPAYLAELYPPQSGDRVRSEISIRLSPCYPAFDLYHAVYPHIVPYPPLWSEMEDSSLALSQYPHFNRYLAIATFAKSPSPMAPRETGPPISVVLRTVYPAFNLYPAIYPAFDIYPGMDDADYRSAPKPHSVERNPVSVQLTVAYPHFDLYRAVYPAFDLYPAFPKDRWEAAAPGQGLSAGYPDFNIYPAVLRSRQSPRTQPKVLSAGYPDFDIYPAVCEAPRTAARAVLSAGYPDFDIYPAVSQLREAPRTGAPSERVLSAGYPDFNIYPAVSQPQRTGARSEPRVLSAGYPDFNIYPAVVRPHQVPRREAVLSAGYPDFNIYPAVIRSTSAALNDSVGSISVRLPRSYPLFDLYPPVYPVLDIYPGFPEHSAPRSQKNPGVAVRLAVCYPIFNLYPALYPTIEIYPALPDDCAAGSRRIPGVSVSRTVAYPMFDLYPAVYPVVELYPSLPEDCAPGSRKRGISIRLAVVYPIFELYSPVYPSLEIYPSLPEDCAVGARSVSQTPVSSLALTKAVRTLAHGVEIGAVARYPVFNLYPAIYPYFDLFPSISSTQEPRVESRPPTQSRFTSSDLHALVTKSPLNSLIVARGPSKSHQALHLAVFPKDADVLTPSGSDRPRTLSKTHLELHRSVFATDVEVSTASGTWKAVSPISTASPSSRVPTRLRSGSVVRMSLPPSPRPVGGRPLSTRGPPPNALPPPPTEAPRRAMSTTTRSSVVDRASGAPLGRSVSMASRPSVAPEPSKLDRTSSVSGPRTNRRDSMVLQRVRALQMNNTESTIKEDDPLSAFPLPPRTSAHPPRKVVS